MARRLSNCRRKMCRPNTSRLRRFPSLFHAGHGKDLGLMITMGLQPNQRSGTVELNMTYVSVAHHAQWPGLGESRLYRGCLEREVDDITHGLHLSKSRSQAFSLMCMVKC
ncbi:hypothetical protein CEXT_815961 [Caerostris extrusa]|uniref:Uncharacterized protein n=1 Tax=Caerostris extrusa TaxID=172846 RepID=A0AAV4W4C1_CAEEX|nr:hypothetical protein CEXT_815961 [Caerostris extrusa]